MNLALIKRIGLWFATIFVLPMTVIPPVQAQQKTAEHFSNLWRRQVSRGSLLGVSESGVR
jgi:hypothetical protein